MICAERAPGFPPFPTSPSSKSTTEYEIEHDGRSIGSSVSHLRARTGWSVDAVAITRAGRALSDAASRVDECKLTRWVLAALQRKRWADYCWNIEVGEAAGGQVSITSRLHGRSSAIQSRWSWSMGQARSWKAASTSRKAQTKNSVTAWSSSINICSLWRPLALMKTKEKYGWSISAGKERNLSLVIRTMTELAGGWNIG